MNHLFRNVLFSILVLNAMGKVIPDQIEKEAGRQLRGILRASSNSRHLVNDNVISSSSSSSSSETSKTTTSKIIVVEQNDQQRQQQQKKDDEGVLNLDINRKQNKIKVNGKSFMMQDYFLNDDVDGSQTNMEIIQATNGEEIITITISKLLPKGMNVTEGTNMTKVENNNEGGNVTVDDQEGEEEKADEEIEESNEGDERETNTGEEGEDLEEDTGIEEEGQEDEEREGNEGNGEGEEQEEEEREENNTNTTSNNATNFTLKSQGSLCLTLMKTNSTEHETKMLNCIEDGKNISTSTRIRKSHQVFTMDREGRIHSAMNDTKCLESNAKGKPILLMDCVLNSVEQQWEVESNGLIRLKNQKSECMTANDHEQSPYMWLCGTEMDQVWFLTTNTNNTEAREEDLEEESGTEETEGTETNTQEREEDLEEEEEVEKDFNTQEGIDGEATNTEEGASSNQDEGFDFEDAEEEADEELTGEGKNNTEVDDQEEYEEEYEEEEENNNNTTSNNATEEGNETNISISDGGIQENANFTLKSQGSLCLTVIKSKTNSTEHETKMLNCIEGGKNISTSTRIRKSHQVFTMDPRGRIHSAMNDSKCLQTNTEGKPVLLMDCVVNSVDQEWEIESNGLIRLKNQKSQCMTANNHGRAPYMWLCGIEMDQIWFFTDDQ